MAVFRSSGTAVCTANAQSMAALAGETQRMQKIYLEADVANAGDITYGGTINMRHTLQPGDNTLWPGQDLDKLFFAGNGQRINWSFFI